MYRISVQNVLLKNEKCNSYMKENLWVFLTDFITGTPLIQSQMLSRQASTKKAPTTESSTSPPSAIFPAYSSTDNGFWTGKEVQFIMYIYKFVSLCSFHVYSLSQYILDSNFASLLDICKYHRVQTMLIKTNDSPLKRPL